MDCDDCDDCDAYSDYERVASSEFGTIERRTMELTAQAGPVPKKRDIRDRTIGIFAKVYHGVWTMRTLPQAPEKPEA